MKSNTGHNACTHTVIGEMSDSCPDPGVVTANISLGGNINTVHSVCVDISAC